MPQKTPLHACHQQLGARLTDFGGWLMPVQYTSITQEHHAVRTACGLFDVSHMGEVRVTGRDAAAFLEFSTTNTAHDLATGRARYALLCYPDGGVVDDLLYYRLEKDAFLVVVNAANTRKDWEWMQQTVQEQGFQVTLKNESSQTALLALQGPRAQEVLAPLADTGLDAVPYYGFCFANVAGLPAMVSRTGYTGEDGFEIFHDPRQAPALWNALLDAGKPFGLVPAGLGARDTLRLEACMPLYGHELDEHHTPIEAGLERFVALDKPRFNGKAVMEKQKALGPPTRLVAFVMEEAAVPRQGYSVHADGQEAGAVTSGTFSPTLQKGIGMAYVQSRFAAPGTPLSVRVRGREKKARVVNKPFYKRKKPGRDAAPWLKSRKASTTPRTTNGSK